MLKFFVGHAVWKAQELWATFRWVTLAGSVERGPARSAQRPRSGTGKAPVETDLRHSISSTSVYSHSNQRHWSVVLSIDSLLIHKSWTGEDSEYGLELLPRLVRQRSQAPKV